MGITCLILAAASLYMAYTRNLEFLFFSVFAMYCAMVVASVVVAVDIAQTKRKGLRLSPATWLGLGAILVALVAILPLSSLLSTPREMAHRITCAYNLGNIYLALYMYSSDWDGQFPPLDGAAGLEILRSNGYLENWKFYVCPSTETRGATGAALTEETVDYRYFGGYTEADGIGIPFLCDKASNHRNYGNVSFLGGRRWDYYTGKEWEEIQAQAVATHERIVGARRAQGKKP
jgi:hypothetical protein